MVRIGPMASPKLHLKSVLDRRELIAGLGAVALAPFSPVPGLAQGLAQGRPALALRARAESVALRPDAAVRPICAL